MLIICAWNQNLRQHFQWGQLIWPASQTKRQLKAKKRQRGSLPLENIWVAVHAWRHEFRFIWNMFITWHPQSLTISQETQYSQCKDLQVKPYGNFGGFLTVCRVHPLAHPAQSNIVASLIRHLLYLKNFATTTTYHLLPLQCNLPVMPFHLLFWKK